MKATIITGKPFELKIIDIPPPKVGPNEVMLKVEACGICPTEIRILSHPESLPEVYQKLPGIPGHEVSGKVVEVGENVKKVRIGDHVVPYLGGECGKCYFCRRGRSNFCINKERNEYLGYCEYIKVKEENCHIVPENITYEETCFAEVLACCLNGNMKSGIKAGDDVVIIGAGPVGLLHTQLATLSGARVSVCDLIPERLKLAKELGAFSVINIAEENLVDRIMELTNGFGADIVIVAVGNVKAMEQALKIVGKGGLINFFAGTSPEPSTLNIDINFIHYNELILTGSHGSTHNQFERAVKLIRTGLVKTKPLISHILPLEEINEGYNIITKKKGLKVIIRPK